MNSQETYGLIHRYLNGEASDAEILALDRILAVDPSARKAFRTLSAIDVKLADLAANAPQAADWMPRGSTLHAQPGFEPEIALTGKNAPVPVDQRKIRSWRFWGVGGLAVAAAILGFVLVIDLFEPEVKISKTVGAEFASPLSNANLIGNYGKLNAGILELHFRRSDASVVIEAPAEFRVEDAGTLRMFGGRVTAHVRDGAKGLRVLTPESEVLDLGTRFAVDVRAGKQSEVHVFEGKVAVGSGRKELLQASQARKLDGSGSQMPEEVDLRRASFVQPEEVNPLATALAAGRKQIWEQTLGTLSKDPDLALIRHFPMNAPLKGGDPSTLQWFHVNFVQGRFPAQGAAEFVDVGDLARMDLGLRTRQLTLMTWARIDRVSKGRSYLLKSNLATGDGGVNWSIQEGKIGFSLANLPPAETPGEKRWPRSKLTMDGDLGVWRHIAVTYNADTKKVCFYVDGSLDSEAIFTAGMDAVLNTTFIGTFKTDNKSASCPEIRMDELVILKRTLSTEEIRQFYNHGNPYF